MKTQKIIQNSGSGEPLKAKTGFARIKPLKSEPKGFYNKKNSYDEMTRLFRQFIIDKGPYDFFITLTFGRRMRIAELCWYVNILVDRYNQILYTARYRRRKRNVKGFAFLEKHLSSIVRNENHFHLLVKCEGKFEKYTLAEHEDIFRKAASRVKDEKDKPVFNDKCIDIRPARDEGAINYCFDQIYDKRLDRIKIIGAGGLSDNSDGN
ncbi:hypothetical protein GSUET_14690 [Geobacter sulfurreducens subsp. ethanolicus]|uniref:hypothetical protein n=1 Tax=Geobacter sulfurreducens TaxID=35554 RepID=UPI002572662E|nr:hypothetical protein [Geobacter sulfurreducens]BEH09857.1 hypothetical protein GSUET_14690 [Geobacter sulfurreducens subsp. ethanolicus]